MRRLSIYSVDVDLLRNEWQILCLLLLELFDPLLQLVSLSEKPLNCAGPVRTIPATVGDRQRLREERLSLAEPTVLAREPSAIGLGLREPHAHAATCGDEAFFRSVHFCELFFAVEMHSPAL